MLIFRGADDPCDEEAFVPVEIKAGKEIFDEITKTFLLPR